MVVIFTGTLTISKPDSPVFHIWYRIVSGLKPLNLGADLYQFCNAVWIVSMLLYICIWRFSPLLKSIYHWDSTKLCSSAFFYFCKIDCLGLQICPLWWSTPAKLFWNMGRAKIITFCAFLCDVTILCMFSSVFTPSVHPSARLERRYRSNSLRISATGLKLVGWCTVTWRRSQYLVIFCVFHGPGPREDITAITL